MKGYGIDITIIDAVDLGFPNINLAYYVQVQQEIIFVDSKNMNAYYYYLD